jgi:hypothetical protein
MTRSSQAEKTSQNRAVKATGLILALVVAPGVANAQMRGGGGMPVTPIGVPLDKVAVGTWAEYSVKRGTDPARTFRHALVAREGGAHVIETRTVNQEGEKMITRSVLATDPTQEGGVKKMIVQMGAADPMELPVGGGPPGGGGQARSGPPGGGETRGGGGGGGGGRMGARWIKPDPKTLVGKETVKTAAGSFQTEHYRTEGRRGGTIDYWIAKEPGPFGLVKMESDRPAGQGGDGGGKVIIELAARGKDAKPEVTKPAKPFNPEMMRNRRGGGGDNR